MTTFKPMLAADADLGRLRFPVLASAKLDGVRAVVSDGVVYSRSNKPIPNRHVQSLFSGFENFDGELIVGSPTSPSAFRDTTSGVMSTAGEPGVTFYVFDHVGDIGAGYLQRAARLSGGPHVVVLEQRIVNSERELLAFEAQVLAQGYEGLILRSPTAPYKFGRSTAREGFLLKLKRFVDAEFEVVGFAERMHNGNEATTDELGRTSRSHRKENKFGRGDLGALILKRDDGLIFNVGTGFNDDERRRIFNNQSGHLGLIAKVKFFSVGMKNAPRFPVFLGFRSASDL